MEKPILLLRECANIANQILWVRNCLRSKGGLCLRFRADYDMTSNILVLIPEGGPVPEELIYRISLARHSAESILEICLYLLREKNLSLRIYPKSSPVCWRILPKMRNSWTRFGPDGPSTKLMRDYPEFGMAPKGL